MGNRDPITEEKALIIMTTIDGILCRSDAFQRWNITFIKETLKRGGGVGSNSNYFYVRYMLFV